MRILFFLIVSVFFTSAFAVTHQKNMVRTPALEPLDRIVAIVNDGVITENQLAIQVERVKKEMQLNNNPIPSEDIFRRQVLQQMIGQKVQLQMAEKLGVQASETDIDQAAWRLAKQNNETVRQLYDVMQARGWTESEFRVELSKEIIIQKLQDHEVASRVSISKQDVEDFIQTTGSQIEGGAEEYHVANILIAVSATPTPSEIEKARAQAEDLMKRLKAGTDFSKAAQLQSNGKQALQGGDLGWRKLPELPTIFADKVTTMKVGDMEGPIQAANGFHLIKLLGKHEGQAKKGELEYEVRLIFLRRSAGELQDRATEETLRNIKKKLEAGESFDQLAKRYSQDSRSIKNGGYVGWVSKKDLDPTVYSMLPHLKSGEISDPIVAEQGWYLVQVVSEKTQVLSSDVQRKEVEQLVFQRKVNEGIDAFVNQLRSESYIKVLQ